MYCHHKPHQKVVVNVAVIDPINYYHQDNIRVVKGKSVAGKLSVKVILLHLTENVFTTVSLGPLTPFIPLNPYTLSPSWPSIETTSRRGFRTGPWIIEVNKPKGKVVWQKDSQSRDSNRNHACL